MKKYQWHVLTIIILVLFWVISATDDFYCYEEFHLKELLLVDWWLDKEEECFYLFHHLFCIFYVNGSELVLIRSRPQNMSLLCLLYSHSIFQIRIKSIDTISIMTALNLIPIYLSYNNKGVTLKSKLLISSVDFLHII